jgi:hypothetical protein
VRISVLIARLEVAQGDPLYELLQQSNDGKKASKRSYTASRGKSEDPPVVSLTVLEIELVGLFFALKLSMKGNFCGALSRLAFDVLVILVSCCLML